MELSAGNSFISIFSNEFLLSKKKLMNLSSLHNVISCCKLYCKLNANLRPDFKSGHKQTKKEVSLTQRIALDINDTI
jgi:hypothetical protein